MSQKETILAVPVQARKPAARNRRRDALVQTPQKKLSAICNLRGFGRDVRRAARSARRPDTTTIGLPTGFLPFGENDMKKTDHLRSTGRIGQQVRKLLPALVAAAAFGGTMSAHATGAVVLYTADGLENLYKDVLPAFEKQEGVKVNIVTAGSGEVVNRANIEKNSPKADVIVTLPPFIQQADQA